jgi:hypothetical protein
MNKINMLKYFLFVLMLFPTACSGGKKMVLEQKDVQFFKVEEIKHKPIALRVSGLAFHRSLAVRDIRTVEKETSLLVFVFLTPSKEGLSGSFNFEVSVPDSVKDVCFGNEKAVIWKRKLE